MPTPCPPNDSQDLTRLLPLMTRRARRLTANAEDAADLVQEAALRLWTQQRGGAGIEDLEPYAMTTLRNLARDRWRRRLNMVEIEEDTIVTQPDGPAHLACAELREAIDRLPDTQALLMRLILQGENSPADLAERTGLPLGTVMSRLSRARKTLRSKVGLEKDASIHELM